MYVVLEIEVRMLPGLSKSPNSELPPQSKADLYEAN